MSTFSGLSSTPVSSKDDISYSFSTEYYDSSACLTRSYTLLYHLLDSTIELYDVKARRTFLKRCSYPSVTLADLHPGTSVIIYSRQLKILDYADEFTRSKLTSVKNKVLVLIKPSSTQRIGSVLQAWLKAESGVGVKINRLKMIQLSTAQAHAFADIDGSGLSVGGRELAGGPLIAMELIVVASNPINTTPLSSLLSSLLSSSPSTRSFLNDVYINSDARTAGNQADYLFSLTNTSTATFNQCSVVVIKPHLLAATTPVSSSSSSSSPPSTAISTTSIDLAFLFDHLLLHSSLQVTAMELFTLDRVSAEEFLEVYKGVVPEFHALVESLCTGSCIAMEVKKAGTKGEGEGEAERDGEEVVNSVREVCGPADPDIGRHIRPNSVRAKFGVNKIKNAVHCTDLPEDGVLESEFFFSILQQQNQQKQQVQAHAPARK